jgi:hypothetical protein
MLAEDSREDIHGQEAEEVSRDLGQPEQAR